MSIFRISPLIITLTLLTGCQSQYSLREQQIISDIPQEQRQYNKGIILNPNKADIKKAISFGENSKDNNSLMYAYIKKGPSNFWDNSDVYVKINTPLYLISSHAKEQAREYRATDAKYINYCKELNAVKISLTQQFNNNFTAYPIKREIILLRNGKRVNTISSIKSYKGKNPFMSDYEKKISKATSDAMNKFYSQVPASNFTMTKEQLKSLESSYRSMGYTNEQIKTYMSAINHGINTSSKPNISNTKITLSETDNVYKTSDLNKLGRYEIVFRTSATNNAFASGDKEIRFPISFSNFK